MLLSMDKLPVIVGFGGISAAGRSSCFHGAARLGFHAYNKERRAGVLASLAGLGVTGDPLHASLVRTSPLLKHSPLTILHPENGKNTLTHKSLSSTAAGQIPDGFLPESLYHAKGHPRGLSLLVFAAADAIHSSGLDVMGLCQAMGPQRMGVFASASIGQHDLNGWGGLHQDGYAGKRVAAKKLPLGYPQMPADFLSAYILGQFGINMGAMGACATFLYNLKLAADSIIEGRLNLAFCATSDAPLTPNVAEAFANMGALAKDADILLRKPSHMSEDEAFRESAKPFGEGIGMILGEGAQACILMDAKSAIEIGAPILGAVPSVFVHADGFKSSITAPGVGNYITMHRATSFVEHFLSKEALKHRSYVIAHGSSTPQNRLTESHILSKTAKAFGIDKWLVTGVKGSLGHTQGTASGDQLMAALATEPLGHMTGIETTHQLGETTCKERLDFVLKTRPLDKEEGQIALLNSKGFGGNNATAVYLSQRATLSLLQKSGTLHDLTTYLHATENALENCDAYDESAKAGRFDLIYRHGEGVILDEEVHVSREGVTFGETFYPLPPHAKS